MLAAAPPALEGYSDCRALIGKARALAKSELVGYTSLARTLGGREVGLLTVGTGEAEKKPALLVVGGIDPARPIDSEVVLRVAQRLVSEAGSDAEVRGLLDRVTFYCVVQAAPDGTEAFFEAPLREGDVNARPIDDDNDGQTDEDGPDDLNGDGLITVMRVEDTSGRHIVHPDNDRVMIEADAKKGERGRYRLYVEGRDNDGDGELNEDPPGGVAFDRNFTFDYPYFQRGAGPHQVSEAETRAIAEFAFEHANIVLVWTLSGRDNLLHRWKPNEAAEKNKIKTTLLAKDAPYFDNIAKVYEEIRGKSKPPEAAGGKGSFIEWAYFHYGRWSLATRPWWIPKAAKKTDESEDGEDAGGEEKKKDDESAKDSGKDNRGIDDLNALAWFEQQGVDGFVDWQPFEHPDLAGKKVEIGGFKPFLKNNPPAGMFDEVAGEQYVFLLKLGDMLPRVKIAELKAEPLGADVWRVTAAVVNEGVLPTASEMGRLTRDPQLLQVELMLPAGVSLVTGHARRSIAPLAGDGGRAEEKWLVRGASDKALMLKVRVWSPMAGSVTEEVRLGGKPE
jgi:hypothetical protein